MLKKTPFPWQGRPHLARPPDHEGPKYFDIGPRLY